jgi:hypothetical protein
LVLNLLGLKAYRNSDKNNMYLLSIKHTHTHTTNTPN